MNHPPSDKTQYPYRVFVSYSRDNRRQAQRVRDRLKELGMDLDRGDNGVPVAGLLGLGFAN